MSMKNANAKYLAMTAIVAGLTFSIASAQRRGAATQPVFPPEERARMAQLGSRGVRVHDPSTIVKHKDEYWVFYTGGGVPSYRSKDLITWTAGPRIFNANPTWLAQVVPPGTGRRGRGGAATAPASGPATTPAAGGGRGGGGVASFWAPDVIRVGDKYFVYFSYSSFGVNTSAIALVSNPTLDPNDPQYKWTEEGIVVQSRQPDNFNAIDPALTFDAEGRLWMAFGSFWSGIKLIELNPKTGLRIAPDSPMHSIAHYGSIEATHIYLHDGYYYQFVNWGRCCQGANSTYDMRIGRSRTITGPYLDKDGKDLLASGGSPLLSTDGAFIGPGHAGIFKEGDKYWMSMHYYDGASGDSRGTLAIRPVTWDAQGWPVVGK